MKSRRGFTLIELLIVVAIIAILAAIAVPNFLEAQIRARVSRTTADLRSVATALESYYVDNNNYPPVQLESYARLYVEYLSQLTTPIAYITSVGLKDPFQPKSGQPVQFAHAVPDINWIGSYNYFRYNNFWAIGCYHGEYVEKGYGILSHGPYLKWSGVEHYPVRRVLYRANWDLEAAELVYNPTNGTKSYGGIARFGGLPGCEAQVGA